MTRSACATNAGLHGKELNRLRKVIDEMDDEISRLSGEERERKWRNFPTARISRSSLS